MKYAAAFVLFVFLCAGCDGYRDFAGPEDPTTETPDPPVARTGTYTVAYDVTGTYYSCEITYINAQRKEVTTPQAVQLPWELTFKVSVDQSTGPFEAKVSATCADPTKLGKSTVLLLVDEDVKARATATGFGATAKVDHRVGTP